MPTPRPRSLRPVEAARRDRSAPPTAGADTTPIFPALDQVTGWSEADPTKAATDEGRALFGGWRLGDIPPEE